MSNKVPSEIVSVKALLSLPRLQIPAYQRPYKWTSKHINQLLQDIDVHHKCSAYRLGTVVVHKEEKAGESFLNIVDGQQRTLTLLLTVWAIIETRLPKLDRKDVIDDLKQLKPLLSSFMSEHCFDSVVSQRNLHQNYLEIDRLVSRRDFSQEHIHFLLNKCEVVFFTLTDVSEAFQFFDSQNARGRDLEPHDLLKAFHLREFSETEAELKAETVSHWESMDSDELAGLFAIYLYRIRQWARGYSARYFSKDDVHLFKGVNLDRIGNFPYVESIRIAHHFVDDYNQQYQRKIDGQTMVFPFHLDQMLINGRRFFEMASHYHNQVSRIVADEHDNPVHFGLVQLSDMASCIMRELNNYEARHRTGDKYVRSMFDCLLIYYIDKFGNAEISRAIEKIFVWSYSLRIKQQVLQLATMDNYVLEQNVFRLIKESTQPSDFLTFSVNTLSEADNKNNRRNGGADSDPLVRLFKEMKYYE